MSKTVRVVMYILSLLTVIGVLAALVVAGRKNGTEQTMQQVAKQEVSQVVEEEVEPEAEGENKQPEVLPETEAENEQPEVLPETEAEDEQPEVLQQTEDATTIIFTGDVLFANAFKAGYDANGIKGVVSEELLQELNGADILMINNEFPFSDNGVPMENKQYTFQCSPFYVKALQEMGVDVVSLANNHTLDYGKQALLDTFQTLDDAGILYGGAGESAERAEEVQKITVNGKTYGFIAVSRVVPTADWKVEVSTPGLFCCYDEARLLEVVKEAKQSCDFVAVYPHWGVEYEAYPENYQTDIAKKCIQAGADVVVGAHTHCLQGVSFIEGKPVCYSLGNFVFGQSIDRSAILKLTVDASGNVTYQFLPVYATGGVTYLATGDQAMQILSYLDGISKDATVDADGVILE